MNQPDLDAAVRLCNEIVPDMVPRFEVRVAIRIVLDALDRLRQPAALVSEQAQRLVKAEAENPGTRPTMPAADPATGFQVEQLNPSLADLQRLLAAEPAPADDPHVGDWYVCERCAHRDSPMLVDGYRRCTRCGTEFVRKLRQSDLAADATADPAALARELIELRAKGSPPPWFVNERTGDVCYGDPNDDADNYPLDLPGDDDFFVFCGNHAADLMRWALERDAAAKDAERMRGRIRDLEAENGRLRAALAFSKDACTYCQLPAAEMAKCKAGFPGCARADDMQGCPEFGAAVNAHDLRARIAELEKELAAARDESINNYDWGM